MPPTRLRLALSGVPPRAYARRPAAGLGIGLGTTHFSRKMGVKGKEAGGFEKNLKKSSKKGKLLI